MLKYSTVLIVLIFSILELNAQELTSKGYVVTTASDTLHGFIKEGRDDQLTKQILFMKPGATQTTVYTAADLAGFAFEYGRTFRSFVVENDSSENKTYLFAKKVLDGKVTLYKSPFESGEPDFFIVNNSNGETVQLTAPRERVVESNGKKYLSTSKGFQYKLMYALETTGQKHMPNLKYAEKPIENHVEKYNENYSSQFPISTYWPKKTFYHDISIGSSFVSTEQGKQTNFRIAYYLNRFSHENTTSVSLMRGISYRYWAIPNFDPNYSVRNKTVTHRKQFISIIPFGVNLHHNTGNVRPYFYAGIGVLLYFETDFNRRDYVDYGSSTSYWPMPTFNLGAGLRIKLKSHTLLIEFTPAANEYAMFTNIGYSF